MHSLGDADFSVLALIPMAASQGAAVTSDLSHESDAYAHGDSFADSGE